MAHSERVVGMSEVMRRCISPAAAAFAVAAFVGCGGEVAESADSPGAVSAELSPATSQPEARFEVRFMTDMIDHHMMAVMMAETCVAEAVHPELRAMCEDIIAAQMTEIETLQSWLRDWYGISHEPEMTPGMERQMERLAALAGAEFEVEFMESMIRHHRKAIREGEACLEKAYHARLIELCEGIVATQTAEIAQLEEWLCEWYGECQPSPGTQ